MYQILHLFIRTETTDMAKLIGSY